MVTVATPTPPTALRGHVSDWYASDAIYDVLEHVPALVFPASIEVYGEMRRDPRLAAIIQGYTLQLRRATWQLDGTGCRPEVVQLVADDMGLPAKGEDKPGPARLRDVSWNEHLRAALLHLPFGFMAFELEATVVDGRARLTSLAERLPVTIDAIHVDPKTGALQGADQYVQGRNKDPVMSADRLAWYCHEREGASWQGTSLLRPAYGPWLLKRELMRVHAQANRRWGMGVPIAQALPGTNPTLSQMTEAQRMVSAARSGDQAGAAMPPGFEMVITGMSGSVPDTLAYIKWLDQQMSQMALMNHLELGTSESGSRSLGQSFIDTLMMALQSIAENVADVATRQIAARIVDWNWNDEQVPRVVVSGIGSQREVTAESLNILLTSGALSSDPALEAWVRREYRLPERAPQPTPTLPPVPPTPAPVAAGRRAPRRPRKEPSPGQLALPILAAAPDPQQLQTEWEQAKADLLGQWPVESSALVDALAVAAGAAAAAGLLAGLGSLTADTAVISGVAGFLAAGMTVAAAGAAGVAVAEVAAAGGMAVAPDGPGAERINLLAQAHADQLVTGYAQAAGRKALTLAGPDAVAATVEAEVRAHLEAMSTSEKGLAGDTFGAALSSAQSAARLEVFAQFPNAVYRAEETNDHNRCSPCTDVNQAEFQGLAAALVAYPAGGGFWACEGGPRCRGMFQLKTL